MTILLQWLVNNAWVFYAGCAMGVIIYFIRALSALRERNLAMFTLERETATSRLIQAWAMILVFIVIGALIFVSANYLLRNLPALRPETPRPTPTSVAGVDTPTPGPTPSPTGELLVPTFTPASTAESASPLPPAEEPTTAPTQEPTASPEGVIAGEVHVRFGDFAELASFSLPASEITTAEPLMLTLYWQADGTSPIDYTVFTHLLAEDGHLIAQHDGTPAYGVRPTTTWVPGESIVDTHPMSFQDTAYTGPARILVGLYDPATGRIATDTGSDHVVLPVAINVVPQ